MLRRRLYMQIYLTVIASLVIVVVLSGLMWNLVGRDRLNRDMFEIVGNLAYLSLPTSDTPVAEQRIAIDRLGHELGVDISLFDTERKLIASSGSPARAPRKNHPQGRWHRAGGPFVWSLHLPDGRWLTADLRRRSNHYPLLRFILFLAVIAVGVGLGAYPLVRRLTRRLEHLQTGVERFGAGDLTTRIEVQGRDEIASLASGFNEAAGKIKGLLDAHRMLLANASHELRTPLSRIRLGVEMLKDGDTERRAALREDIAELDELIDEILLMSRLDAGGQMDPREQVDLLALAAEEATHYPDVTLEGTARAITGDARLLRRMIRNLLENADTHGAPPVCIQFAQMPDAVVLTVTDAGKGIAEADRDRVFQPFYRAPDRQNLRGYGLGLALVRQIAKAHDGTVEIRPRTEATSAISVRLPH